MSTADTQLLDGCPGIFGFRGGLLLLIMAPEPVSGVIKGSFACVITVYIGIANRIIVSKLICEVRLPILIVHMYCMWLVSWLCTWVKES